jgi:hypothetical protein
MAASSPQRPFENSSHVIASGTDRMMEFLISNAVNRRLVYP